MALIGGAWAAGTWVSTGGWALHTWSEAGEPEPEPEPSVGRGVLMATPVSRLALAASESRAALHATTPGRFPLRKAGPP